MKLTLCLALLMVCLCVDHTECSGVGPHPSKLICLTILLNVGVVKSATNVGLLWGKPGEEKLRHVSYGQAGVWGVRQDGKVVYRQGTYSNDGTQGDNWSLVSQHIFKQIDVGTNIVWAITENNVSMRLGISNWTPKGCGWYKANIAGKPVHISVSNKNHMWLIMLQDKLRVFRRAGASLTNPAGDKWEKTVSGLRQISVGPSGVWGVDTAGSVYYINGTFGDTDTRGTALIRIEGDLKFKYLSSGNGVIHAIRKDGKDGNIYRRSGMTAANPIGLSWVSVRGRASTIEAGENTVWVVSNHKAFVKTTR